MTKSRGKVRRQIFVLTPEEKKTICFIAAAFAIGLATKHFRDTHPRAAPTPAVALHATPRPRSFPRKPRVRHSPPPSAEQLDESGE
ncbi:MAG: hypothetical protein H0U99_10100 [Chthoniobacterales bacterium]|nr:hypothetical protein [Chthoniobacterales bacterium]